MPPLYQFLSRRPLALLSKCGSSCPSTDRTPDCMGGVFSQAAVLVVQAERFSTLLMQHTLSIFSFVSFSEEALRHKGLSKPKAKVSKFSRTFTNQTGTRYKQCLQSFDFDFGRPSNSIVVNTELGEKRSDPGNAQCDLHSTLNTFG
jgi:hypothetical protein